MQSLLSCSPGLTECLAGPHDRHYLGAAGPSGCLTHQQESLLLVPLLQSGPSTAGAVAEAAAAALHHCFCYINFSRVSVSRFRAGDA